MVHARHKEACFETEPSEGAPCHVGVLTKDYMLGAGTEQSNQVPHREVTVNRAKACHKHQEPQAGTQAVGGCKRQQTVLHQEQNAPHPTPAPTQKKRETNATRHLQTWKPPGKLSW